MATINIDIPKHIDLLIYVYDNINGKNALEQYNYFLDQEHEFIEFIRAAHQIKLSDNFASHILLLNPTNRKLNIAFDKLKSLNEILVCVNCKQSFALADKYNLHIQKNTIQCKICSTTNPYDLFFLTNIIKKNKHYIKKDDCDELITKLQYIQNKLSVHKINETILDREKKIFKNRLEKEYNNLSYCPFDLVKGMMRQVDFTIKINKNIDFYKNNDFTNRYLQFLEIIKTYKIFAVPTLEIDFFWHTHMRNPEQYDQHMKEYFGYVLNHDDTIESNLLEYSYVNTCIHWANHFKEPYGKDIPNFVCVMGCFALFPFTKSRRQILCARKIYRNNRAGTETEIEMNYLNYSSCNNDFLFTMPFLVSNPFSSCDAGQHYTSCAGHHASCAGHSGCGSSCGAGGGCGGGGCGS